MRITDPEELHYACSLIYSICRLPLRLYRGGERAAFFAPEGLDADPAAPFLERLLAIDRLPGFYMTPQFSYYGVLGAAGDRIVLGPTKQIADDTQTLRSLAFELDVPPAKTEAFLTALKSIPCISPETFLRILCALNFAINGERLSLQDISIFHPDRETLNDPSGAWERQKTLDGDAPADETKNALFSWKTEQTLLNLISHGEKEQLRDWIAHAPPCRGGILADDQLRQSRNTFIVITALSARAAVLGGMDYSDAMSLSDSYIRKAETIHHLAELINLEYNMVLDYTERVEHLRQGKDLSKLVLDVKNYIRHHLSESISVRDMAKHLYIGYAHLSAKFRKETGETLTDFILKEKAQEAKRLLQYTDKTVTAIGFYLGFSSQSHFARVFKKYVGVTPKEYRASCKTAT